MAFSLSFLLVLTLIPGTGSTSRAKKVSVKTGASVSVPCLYSPQYRDNVKYLCEGYEWFSCSYAVKTNTQQSSEKYSISVDKNKNIFTVTMKQTNTNSDYWCAVEIDYGPDDGYDFHLSVTSGTPSLYVDSQEVTGFIGGNTTINCHYRTSGGMKWCKLGSTCVTEGSGSIDGTSVTMNTRADNVFSVIMTDLRPESSGWYYCVRGDFQMPVHLTVAVKPAVTPSSALGTQATTTVPSGQERSSVDLTNFIIPLSLLIFIVIVALIAWLILRHKRGKADSTKSKQSKEEVTYTDVRFKKKTAVRGSENDEDVTYSSVVIRMVQKEKDVCQGNFPCVCWLKPRSK
ncbi:transcript variant X1 [Nothobranchius furzeri]|uniref:Transcript variant X1 n=4 Tax=Nothobranchius furzeri TaxID=105023 RepID=A0A9D3BV26_NOTFU|nr:transcript variant X1 [Nothobranchius furzeri]